MNGKKYVFFIRRAPVLLMISVLLFSVSLAAQVQVPVTISSEKIVVEGKVYFMHQVMKGQTLYSIARAYSISVDQLTRENDIRDNAIKEGQMLRIPAAAVAQGQAAQNASRSVTLPPPAPAAPNGQAGRGSYPASGPAATAGGASGTQQQDDRYIYHRVERGETLGTISGRYGITVRELKRANRGLLFPQEGDYLLIPRKRMSDPDATGRMTEQAQVITAPDTLITDTVAVEEEPEIFTALAEKTSVERLHGSVRVAVLFPFFIRENNTRTYIDSTTKDSRGNVIYREVTKSPTAIYDGSLPFLEAYEGILVATDSLRSLGLTVELDVYDTGADSSEIKRLLRGGSLDGTDLIIGPVFSRNLDQVAGWAAERDIPFVSPVALRDGTIQENKPTLYRVFPSQNVVQDIIAREVGMHPESKVIFLHADSAMYDPSTERFWKKVKDVADMNPGIDESRAVAYYFTGMVAKRDVYSNVTSLESLLDPEKENLIILASTSTPVVSSAFSALHSLIKRYKIVVIGYPEIRGLETIDLKYFYDLELLIPSESYIDYDSPAVKTFTSSYLKKFKTEPMAESFAWRGFDIAWYFIGGIATGGKRFLRDPGIFNPELLCLEPDFRRDSRQDGYENRGMFILQYRKDMTIDFRRPWRGPDEDNEEEQEGFSLPFSGSSVHNRPGSEYHQD
jgi:LysM repeat protein